MLKAFISNCHIVEFHSGPALIASNELHIILTGNPLELKN